MELGSDSIAAMRTADQGLDALRYMAAQCRSRPMTYAFIQEDIRRWPQLTDAERQTVFERGYGRAGAVCPWVRTKGRVRDAAEAMGITLIPT